jgi:hypothetical protein
MRREIVSTWTPSAINQATAVCRSECGVQNAGCAVPLTHSGQFQTRRHDPRPRVSASVGLERSTSSRRVCRCRSVRWTHDMPAERIRRVRRGGGNGGPLAGQAHHRASDPPPTQREG